ncbi:MAG: single-stranded DNA-binding protein [Lentisphaeria bacterium]|nr:single-stranded DNA-binding protein [Lentisphaeria bacterium]
MASLNKVLLIGNLTRDPELRYLTGGNSAVCEFGIAINRRFMQASGQEKDETCFLEIVVWGKQAETCSRFLQKGSTVFIEGRLVYDQWTEKDTQKKRSRVRVTAERVQFLSGRRDDQGGAPGEMPPEDDGFQQRAPRQGGYQPQGGYPSQGGYQGQGGFQNRAPQGQPYRRQQFDEPQYNPAPNMQPGQGGMPDSGPDPLENVDDIPF